MEANQKEVNDAISHDVESNGTHSEVKIEIKEKERSTIQPPIEKSIGDNGSVRLALPSQDGVTSGADKAESEPGNNTDTVESSSEKDVCKSKNDGVSGQGQNGSKEISIALETRVSSKKRSFSPDVRGAFEYREKNFLFRPVKRSRFAFDNDSRIGRIENLRPTPTDKVFPSQSKTHESCGLMVEMFDDAEDDNTFDLDSYQKLTSTTSTIRADLVAAILGTPARPNTTDAPVTIRSNSSLFDDKSTNSDSKRKRVTNKKLKKKSTEKERIAAVAILDGEIDLLRILPREDCMFLAKECFIFTLRQLEWVIGDNANSEDSYARQKGRESLIRNLRGHFSMIRASNQEVDVDSLLAEKLEVWKESIKTWKQGSRMLFDHDQFPLIDGPMSAFFPTGTLQFLQSIKVKVLFDFLCLKKTESGLVVEMFRAWREKCGLKDLNLLPLAKHLIGINSCIEASLKRKFDAEEDFAKWVTGPMVVLSGAAKEFLVDFSKVFSGVQFIETKTKTLADQFCEWRSKTGLSALRGSGNVAMISAWKTQIKDELEICNSEGKVIPEEEIGIEAQSVPEVIPRRRAKAKKADHDSLATHEALNSTEFFSRCFPDGRKLAMLKSVGITTAQSLLDADKGKNSTLLKVLIQYKSEESNGKEIQIASCVSLLYDWASRVKKKVNDIEKVGKSAVSQVVDKDAKSKGNRNGKKKSNSMDPFDALSKPSKEFLRTSMNIDTASEFLETRTTDIANAFIKWRVEKGMTALKGLGAVASISGWKKLVRTKAASVGDLNLAELNQARHAKSVLDEARFKIQSVEHRTGGLDNQLGTLGVVQDKGQETVSMELQSKNILSARSYRRDAVFHFEFITRKNRLKDTVTYLRYLGSDPRPSLALSVYETSGYATKECAVVKPSLYGKPREIASSGRRHYDSITDGIIELRYSGYAPERIAKKTTDIRPCTLEYLMKEFLVKEESEGKTKTLVADRSLESRVHSQQKIEEPRKAFNVFGVVRHGIMSYVLHHPDPIEKGQSVELQFLPLEYFDESSIKNGDAENLRKMIEVRLQKLPVGMLLKVLEQLRVLGPYPAHLNAGKRAIIKRRRAHWLAVKIHENLQKVVGREPVTNHVTTDFLWTKLFIDQFRDPPEFRDRSVVSTEEAIRRRLNVSLAPIKEEIRRELKHEFTQRGFDGFASSMCIWCPLAKTLFSRIVDLFANFCTEFGGACVGDDLISELSSLVSESTMELKKLYQSFRSDDTEDFSKIALMYRESSHHNSNAFPSFQDIKQKYLLEPNTDAMKLCNERMTSIDSKKEVRIVATKRMCESNEIQTTRFEDLNDTKIDEKNRIDIRWYIDTQVLAVALSAIRCGTSMSTLEDTTEHLRNIESQIMEAAHKCLAEAMVESLPFDDFRKEQHLAISTLGAASRRFSRLFNRRSLTTPSSSPFFFGFIWPVLREGGWKMVQGSAPTDAIFLYPISLGGGAPKRVDLRKDSVARQRSQLARESSTLGLGYIPKLTKRLLIKCSEKDENPSTGPAKVSSGPSTKTVLDKFASSLLLNIEAKQGPKNGSEQIRIKGIIIELISLFNKLVPLSLERKEEWHLTEGEQWCDVLGCRYLFKFLIILPNILQGVDIPAQQYSNTIGIVQELLTFLSNNHQSLFDKGLKLPNEEYNSESGFPSTLPSQIMNFSQTTHALDPKKEESEKESVEAILPKDRGELTDFVHIVMSQTIIGRSTIEHTSRHGIYGTGHPYIVCRHCLGMKKGGKYFYGSYDSIATAVTAVEKHILRCTEIDDAVRRDMMEAKVHHAQQRKNLPFGSQSAFFVRLFDRMRGIQTNHEPGRTREFSMTASSSAGKESKIQSYSTLHSLKSHQAVMRFIQDENSSKSTSWRSTKQLEKMIDKYYNCLEYGGKLSGTEKCDSTFCSEWLYSKLKN